MNARQLILLSPYRLPTDTTLYMADEEVSAILSGHAGLWHPAALAVAESLPRLALAHEHEEPVAEAIYAVPDVPALYLPDGWADRARAAGALVFPATPDRRQTLDNLRNALLPSLGESENKAVITQLATLDGEQVRPFTGIGFACLLLDALCEAMAHDNVLPLEDLSRDIAAAVAALATDPGSATESLQAAADRLLAAREILYPVNLFLLDLYVVDPDKLGAPFPCALDAGLPLNVLASAELLTELARSRPDLFATIRERVATDRIEIIGGPFREREDPLLPLESQLWNLRRGQETYRTLIGQEVHVFGRRRSGFHAQTPLLLQACGFSHALVLSFDEASLPSHHSAVVSWPSHNGKQVDGFTRTPQPADTPQTGFHLAHHLHQTIMQDQSATLMLLHRGRPDADWYADLVALCKLAPVLGRPVTLSSYFGEVVSGDYTSASSPDEFQTDYLSDRSGNPSGQDVPALPPSRVPISGFATQIRDRRRLDAAWTYATILRTLSGTVPEMSGRPFFDHLSDLENRFEENVADTATQVATSAQHAAEALATRLLSRATTNTPGYLLLNPCCFTRRVAVELDGITGTLLPGGPIKAVQQEGSTARVVVELPPLGFSWVSRVHTSATLPASRMRLADERTVRNEFFEAEIDLVTGGLKSLRDSRFRISRVGQQLVYNPGSTMKATSVQVLSTGPALGEILAEGNLQDESGKEIARFRQRYRAWLGRPMLEMRLELEPLVPLEGYPWHSYMAARFAWRDEQVSILRGTTALRSTTSQNRPESPDFVELRVGRPNTVLFPGGLPFHQRFGGRMLDVLLLCQGETGRAFEIGVGLDREQPAQTALGVVSPVAVVAAENGPPHVGVTGWLYQLDAANVLLTSLRPALDHPDGLVATLIENTGSGGPARFHCVRNPVRAIVQDIRGTPSHDLPLNGDAVELDISASELMQLRVEFS